MKDWKEIWPDRASPSGQMKKSLCPEEKTEVWVYKAQQVHGTMYDYSRAKYTTTHAKITVICKDHGEFQQIASGHLKGNGCPECFGSKKKTTEQFLKEAIEVHGSTYDYSKSSYVSAHEKVEILCKTHGSFWQTPRNHVQGKNGCPHCSIKTSSDTVYLLNYYGNVYKVGVTNNLDIRVRQLSNSFGMPVKVVASVQATNVFDVESSLLNKYTCKPILGRKFDGYTELRILTEQEVAEICSFLETI